MPRLDYLGAGLAHSSCITLFSIKEHRSGTPLRCFLYPFLGEIPSAWGRSDAAVYQCCPLAPEQMPCGHLPKANVPEEP